MQAFIDVDNSPGSGVIKERLVNRAFMGGHAKTLFSSSLQVHRSKWLPIHDAQCTAQGVWASGEPAIWKGERSTAVYVFLIIAALSCMLN